MITTPEKTAPVTLANDRLERKFFPVTNAPAYRRLESVKIQKSFKKFVAAKFFFVTRVKAITQSICKRRLHSNKLFFTNKTDLDF